MAKKATNIIGIVCFLALSVVVPGFTQQAPTLAAVDLQKAFETSAEGKNVLTQLRQKEQAILSELDKYDRQILSLETKLKAQSLTLTYDAQQKMATDLDNLRTQRKRLEEDSTKDFQRLQFTLVNELRNEVLAVIESYAKEKQISLVFDLSSSGGMTPGGIIYCQPSLDITSEIIKRYDASKATGKS
jgi:Skp family chaperone for outer membrane proteins